MAVLRVDDQVVFRGRNATFSAVVRDVRRAAGRYETAVVVRPVYDLPKRHFPAGDDAVVIDLAGRIWRGVIGGATDQAVSVLLQQVENTGDRVDLRLARADLLSKAKLAKSFEEFDVMLSAVNAIGHLHQELSQEEIEFTLWSYKFLADKHFSILKELRAADTTGRFADTPARVIREFYETVKRRLLKHCFDCIKYTEDHLLPFSSLEKRAVYYRMIGDFYWLAFDHIDEVNKETMLAKAVGSYELGISVMKHCRCVPGDATYLGLILNLSIILHDLLNAPHRACSIALEAVNATHAKLLSPEANSTCNLINEKLRIWSSRCAAPVDVLVLANQTHQGTDAVVAPNGPDVADVALADEDNEVAYGDNDEAMADGPDVEDGVAAYALQNADGGEIELGQIDHHQLEDDDLLVPQNVNEVVNQNLGQIEADAMFENGNQVEAVQIAHHQLVDGPLPVPQIVNQVPREHQPREHQPPFEEPPMDLDLESKGNCFNGKNYRFQRLKKSEMKSKYG